MDDQEKLKKSEELHHNASQLADEAFFARREGETDEEVRLVKAAYRKEADASKLLRHVPSHRMHAIIHQSAAMLAYRCGEYRAAEKLIAHGLAGDLPDLIREELYELLAKVRLNLRLSIEPLPEGKDTVVMILQGIEADSGVLEHTFFADRIVNLGSLIRNTVGFVNKFDFGDLAKVNENYRVLATPPTAGSFRISMKLTTKTQMPLPNFEVAEEVYGKILDNFSTLKKGNLKALRTGFNDDDYFHDFMKLARELAPDGDRVTAVGIEAGIEGSRNAVVFDRTMDDLNSIYSPPTDERRPTESPISDSPVTVVGELLFANSMSPKEEIRLLSDDGQRWRIGVTLGKTRAIAKSHYGDKVEVTGREIAGSKTYKALVLETITIIDDNQRPLL